MRLPSYSLHGMLMMSVNEHTGDEMKTGHASDAYRQGWETIFGQINKTMKEQLDAENTDMSRHPDKAGSES